MHGNPNIERLDIREYKMQAVNAVLEDSRNHLIDPAATSHTEMELTLFAISKPNLEGLRNTILAHATLSNSATSWITSSDALSAFLWDRINRARISQSRNTTLQGNLSLVLDSRMIIEPPLPEKYMGNAVLAVPVTLPIHSSSVYNIAVAISDARNEFTNKSIRDMIGFLEALKGDDITKERAMYTKTLNPTLAISNLKDFACYQLDWGTHLGFMDCLRSAGRMHDCIPRVYPFPQRRDGTVELFIWIEKIAMNRLREDELWKKWMVPLPS